ncbi:MAG: HlyD family efflux transporter periplasmic adaptor subunit [Sumerlaeia bacterium]
MKKIVAILSVTILAAASYGAVRSGIFQASAPEATSEGIPAVAVTKGPFEVTVHSIGALQAGSSAILSSPFDGKITRMIAEGTYVEPGEPVIWFDTTDDRLQLDEQEAQLALDKKDLEQAETEFEALKKQNAYQLDIERTKVEIARQALRDAEQTYEAEKTLFEQNISPEVKFEAARLDLMQSRLSLRNAQINLAKVEENLASNLRKQEQSVERQRLAVEKTERKVEERRERLESSVLTAQTPGEVNYMTMWRGGQRSKIAEGDQVWDDLALAEIPDTRKMLASVPVSELDVSKVAIGQSTLVELEAMPGQMFEGTVESKSILPVNNPNWGWERSENSREYEVLVRLATENPAFRPGMTARVKIVTYAEEEALQVPLEAIQEKDGARGVYVAGEGAPRWEPVTVAQSNDNFGVIAGNVKAGDPVLLLPPDAPDDLAEEPVTALQESEPEGRPTFAGPDGAPS